MSDLSNSQPATDGDSVQRLVGQIIRFRVGKSSRSGLILEAFHDGDLLVSEKWARGNRHRRVKPTAILPNDDISQRLSDEARALAWAPLGFYE